MGDPDWRKGNLLEIHKQHHNQGLLPYRTRHTASAAIVDPSQHQYYANITREDERPRKSDLWFTTTVIGGMQDTRYRYIHQEWGGENKQPEDDYFERYTFFLGRNRGGWAFGEELQSFWIRLTSAQTPPSPLWKLGSQNTENNRQTIQWKRWPNRCSRLFSSAHRKSAKLCQYDCIYLEAWNASRICVCGWS